MSYQVLARKYRPRDFTEMVGQAHVLRALINGLDQQRLHHAFLFSGTRGVGKTTLARILARCLNCENGVTSRPCGVCNACVEIGEGRFVDLIEVDAASRTRVEDTRELLDNVQYAPTRARYKIYLIDEVHMLSTHSFNALLKTLEEPPPHVKFLLATTDPQKLPITVLSRCLQFNLKRVPPDLIAGHLQHVLELEQVAFEERALRRLARAADGSLRDSLSLTDQAIAHGAGQVTETAVVDMLGSIEDDAVLRCLEGLSNSDGAAVLAVAAELAEQAVDAQSVLASMLDVLHRLALLQWVPESLPEHEPERDRLLDLAARLSPEDVQLFYQIGVQGREDLGLAPDQQAAFEMLLLRMLHFRLDVLSAPEPGATHGQAAESPPAYQTQTLRPDGAADCGRSGKPQPGRAAAALAAVQRERAERKAQPERKTRPENKQEPEHKARPERKPQHAAAPPPPAQHAPHAGVREATDASMPGPARRPDPSGSTDHPAATTVLTDRLPDADAWNALVARLALTGVGKALITHCEWVGCEGRRLMLRLPQAQAALRVPGAEQRIEQALADALDSPVSLQIDMVSDSAELDTPAARQGALEQERQHAAEAAIDADPTVRTLRDVFGAELIRDSIRPINQNRSA